VAEIVADVREGAVDHMDHEASLRHLMRVAAGLESLVLGEDQIIGQLKTAFEASRAADGIGPLLDDAITKAIHVGERARTETAINEGVVSLGSAAVKLANRETDLTGSTALVVGAGEMGALAANALESAGVDRVLVANRTIPHATHIAETLDVEAAAIGLDAAASAAETATVVITATGSPEYVLDTAGLADAGKTICIDLAQPRDIDPDADTLDAVAVYDIDDLETVTESTHRRRRAAAEEVEAMIDEEFDRLLALFKRKRADEAISTMYESAERVKSREVSTAFAKLDAHDDLTDKQREVIESLADSLVGQLLSAPTKSLREAAAEDDWTTIQTAMQLFNPDFDGGFPPSDDETQESTPSLRETIPEELSERLPEGVPRDEIPPHVLEQLSDD
jgi:glutamyl-tRNA reductase